MNNVRVLEVPHFMAFRGRFEEEGMRPQPMPAHFGPPPTPEVARANRYNKAGQVVLYLATSRHGVALETRTEIQPPPNLWCQEYAIKITTAMRIADFSDSQLFSASLLDNFVHMVCDRA